MLVLRPSHVSWRQQTGLVYAFSFWILAFSDPRNLDLDPIGAIIVSGVSHEPPRS